MQESHARNSLVFLVFACLLMPLSARGVEVTSHHHPLSDGIFYLSDPTGTLTLEHLLEDPSTHPFTSSSEGKPDENFSPIWLKIELDFSGETLDKHYFLFTRIENLHEIRLYRPDGQGRYREWVTGNDYPVSTRDVDAPRYGFLIEPSEGPQTLYIRFIGGPGSNLLPWDLVEKEAFHAKSDPYYGIDVATFSAIITLLIFNLFIALSLRKAEYLYYSAYVLSVTMGLATLDGLGFYYLWPDLPALNPRALHSFNLLSSATRLLTILAFLGVASYAPRLHRAALWVLGILGVALLVVNAVGVTHLPPFAPTIPWAIGIFFGFVICGHAVFKKIRLAVPLFITLAIPSVAAALQAVLTVNVSGAGVLELQVAKVGFVVHVLMFSLCVAAQIKIETESRILALHDSLTGLPGTTLLRERFDLAANLCRRQGMKTAVLFVDLDGFKAVNDTLGHAAGDQLLVQVAGRIQVELRRTDTVVRIGGDEFVVLLTQVTDEDGVAQVADKLLTSVAKPYVLDGRQARISASIGIAMFPEAGEELDVLLEAADTAMYDAKHRGKNTFTISPTRIAKRPTPVGSVGQIADTRTS